MSQVVTHESWLGRLGGSIKGVVAGLLLFAISFPTLFLNEGRAVNAAKALQEGATSVVEASSKTINHEHEGKFVHVKQ